MKLGAISDVEFVLHDPRGEGWDFHNFTLSPDSASFTALPDSAFATPARYVAEVFHRLCTLDKAGHQTTKFVFNPLYVANRLAILLVVAKLRALGSPDKLLVLTDQNGRPAGYLFPSWLQSGDCRFLALLSTISGDVDAELLRRALLSGAVSVAVEHLDLRRARHNGFLCEENRFVYEWVARRAIAILTTCVTSEIVSEAIQQRNTIPFTAVMPYHAGDLLFFCIAINGTRSDISRVVVNKAYVAIVHSNAPALSTLTIDMTPANRDHGSQRSVALPDYAYFERFCNELPKNSFYGYYRASRNYNTTKHHLVDHFAFALGEHFDSPCEFLTQKRPSPELFFPRQLSGPRRVLLHFDGGWPMKVYPRELQENLVDLLSERGFAMTILASTQYEHPKCEVAIFTGYERFVEMLRGHHLLVGMDSFPAHYAAHVLGLPTICLFANTQPENSDARPAVHYSYLEKGLRCRPCAGVSQCPLYGDHYCRNFADPETVAIEVTRMLEATGNPDEDRLGEPATLTQLPARRRAHATSRRRKQHVHIRFIRLKIAIGSAVLPAPRYLSQLYREFSDSVRKEGILLAAVRTRRYLLRLLGFQ